MSCKFDENKTIERNYSIVRLISRGGFGTVYEAVNLRNSRRCAIKVLDEAGHKGVCPEFFLNEGRILKSIANHRHVVRLYGERVFGSTRVLEMELLESSLHEVVRERVQRNEGLSEANARQIVRNLLTGLQYLHASDLIHRDLKPENLGFVDASDFDTLKIFDFGLSARLTVQDNRMVHSAVGTVAYMAPEMFAMSEYNGVSSPVRGHVECRHDRLRAAQQLQTALPSGIPVAVAIHRTSEARAD